MLFSDTIYWNITLCLSWLFFLQNFPRCAYGGNFLEIQIILVLQKEGFFDATNCLPRAWKYPQHHHENGFRWTGLLSCPNLSREQDFQSKLMPWSRKSSHSGGLQGLCWSLHMAVRSRGWCWLRVLDLRSAPSADFLAHFTWPGESRLTERGKSTKQFITSPYGT